VSEWVSQSGCQSASQFSSASQRANQPTSQSSSSASQHISRLRTRHGHETGETYLWQSSEEQLMHVPVADTACLPSSTHSMHVAGSLGASPETSTWARVVASSNPSPGIHRAHSTCAHTEAQDKEQQTCCEFQCTCRRWHTVYAHALAHAQAHSHTRARARIRTSTRAIGAVVRRGSELCTFRALLGLGPCDGLECTVLRGAKHAPL
jgi:hypothetical protein